MQGLGDRAEIDWLRAVIDAAELHAWLDETPRVQRDCRNIVKRKGKVERLV